jgi:hypothetical protein
MPGDDVTVTRGTSNTNDRGSAASRRRRKQALLVRDGDGISAPCWECGTSVTFSTMICDRKKPGKHGGRYQLSNLRVHCRGCSETQGARMALESRRWKEWHRRGLRRSRVSPWGLRGASHRWYVHLGDRYVGYITRRAAGAWTATHWLEAIEEPWPMTGDHQTLRAALYALLVESTTKPRKAAA